MKTKNQRTQLERVDKEKYLGVIVDSKSNFRHHINTKVNLAETRARVGRPQTSSSPPVFSLLTVPRRLFCFDSLVILDVARCYLWLFSLYINIKTGKNS